MWRDVNIWPPSLRGCSAATASSGNHVLGEASGPGPAAGATPPAVSRPGTECRGRGPGWLARIRPGRASQHFHQGSDTCLQSRLDE